MSKEKQLATLVGLDLILSPEHYKEIEQLQQETKQLKGILTELEEWLKEQEIEYPSYYWDLKNKIQELKEKYK